MSSHRPILAAHGTRQRYQRGCSCVSCRDANRTFMAQWRKAKATEKAGKP